MARWLAVAALLAFAGVTRAGAQESLDDVEKATHAPTAPKFVAVNGYGSNRLSYSYIDPGATFLPTRDQPSLQELFEANVQLKINFGRAFAYGDLSGVVQGGWLYYTDDQMGGRAPVGDHYVSSLQPFVALSELYLSGSPRPWLNLLIGKRRVVWGSGFAFNPTDVMNPPRDPTNPNFQRAGSWIARVEAPFEKFTVTLAAAPGVLHQSSGLPSTVLRYPSYPIAGGAPPDQDYHYLLAARVYALLYDSDVNLIYYFSNQFQDGFRDHSRFGASFSRYFFNAYELHVEALVQQGSARVFADHACATGGACPDPTRAFGATRLASSDLYPRVLAGGRHQFRDESLLSFEYYYQGDGYSDDEYADFVRALLKARPLLEAGMAGQMGVQSGGALPTYFTFDPLRQHYLILSYNKPKIHDDWTVGATLILGLRDLSGVVTPTVSWSATEWLTLWLTAYVPIRGIPVGQAMAGGKAWSEYSLSPFAVRLLFEARAYY